MSVKQRVVGLALVLLGGAVAAGGCNCGTPQASAETSQPVNLELGPGPTAEEAPIPGSVYKEAYEKALQQLDSNSARDRLREIEKQISREQRDLP